MAQALPARWFDGRSSRARPVLVQLLPAAGGPQLALQDPDSGQRLLLLDHGQLEWPQAWNAQRAAPRVVVDLRAHGSLELDDAARWQQALVQAGHAPPLAQRMQTRWSVFLAVALVAIAALMAFYRWGTPWAATQLTRQVPLAWETRLAEQALRDLDAGLLAPSRLPPERQRALRERFQRLAAELPQELQRYRGYRPPLRLAFRRGLGANAFALPGGTIVLTDEMVELAAHKKLSDDALLGVLAHEIGHVQHRHTTRMLVEQGVLNVGLGLALGDVSWLLSSGSALLTGLAYRRSHEAEADCFALALMGRAGLSTAPMGILLLAAQEQDQEQDRRASEQVGWLDILSSHPATPQRARDLQRGQAQGCG